MAIESWSDKLSAYTPFHFSFTVPLSLLERKTRISNFPDCFNSCKSDQLTNSIKRRPEKKIFKKEMKLFNFSQTFSSRRSAPTSLQHQKEIMVTVSSKKMYVNDKRYKFWSCIVLPPCPSLLILSKYTKIYICKIL